MTETWGLLAKSAVDDETIEEAIDRIVAAHNDDEEAHLEVGQSLQSHKVSDIIDHLAKSIIADKIGSGEVNFSHFTANHKFIFTTFDSLDGWHVGGVGTPVRTCVLGGSKLETSGTDGDTSYICASPNYGFGDNPNFDSLPFAQALIKIMDTDYAETHFHIGYQGFQAAGHDYIGFLFDQAKVYAVCRESSSGETKSEITTPPDPLDPHVYRIVYVSSSKVDFYIDDVLLKTITTNIPISNNEDSCIFLGVKNSHDGGEQTIGIYHALYQEQIV